MGDLAAEKVDETERWKVSVDSRVGEIGCLRKDEPDAVVFRLFLTVTQHEHDLLPNIYSETGKHGPDFGREWTEGFDDKGKGGRSALGLGRTGDSDASVHSTRIERKTFAHFAAERRRASFRL